LFNQVFAILILKAIDLVTKAHGPQLLPRLFFKIFHLGSSHKFPTLLFFQKLFEMLRIRLKIQIPLSTYDSEIWKGSKPNSQLTKKKFFFQIIYL